MVQQISMETKWIDCSERMPEEIQYEKETASRKVLVWDIEDKTTRLDYTRNGKWAAARMWPRYGESTVAWMPIPEMDIEKYK